MSDPVLIYGATGYTGQLIVRGMLELGLRPILCARNESKLASIAEGLGLECRVADLANGERLDAALRNVRVVLHTAGPFSQTALPMAAACLRTGTHYLDISGEPVMIEALAQRHAEARRRGIMIMPGVGFDVVPSDCLAAHVAGRLRGADRLAIGVRGLALMTRGSGKSFAEQAGPGIRVRRDGVITVIAPSTLERTFDYGSGPQPSVNVSWGDVASAYYTTGIPNIQVYFEANPFLRSALLASRFFGPILMTAPWQVWLKMHADLLPEGPTAEQRAAVKMVIVAEAEDGRGRRARARLRTPEAYTFTSLTAPIIAQRVLRGDHEPGFQTPGRVYGADFVLSFANVCREDLD